MTKICVSTPVPDDVRVANVTYVPAAALGCSTTPGAAAPSSAVLALAAGAVLVSGARRRVR